KDIDERLVGCPMTAAKKVPALASDQPQFHSNAARFTLPNKLLRPPEDVGIKGTAEPPVTRDDDQTHNLKRAVLKQRLQVPVCGTAQVGNDPPHLQSVGAKRQDTTLGAPELRGRDHFHGLGDLLGILYGADLAPQSLKARHGLQNLVIC